MNKINNNGMSNKVAAANIENNNNQNNYEFYRISGGHNFADLAGAVEKMKDVNDAIGVRGYEGIRIFVRRDEGMWTLTMFNLVGIGEASHEEKYNLGQRMTANMVKRIENLVLAFIDTIADYEEERELNNTTARYQSELDGYVEDLKGIANKATDINTAIGIAASTLIVKKLEQLNKDYIKSLEEITGWTDWADIYDHYTLDWDAFAEWLDAYATWDDGEFICDFDAIKSNINSLIVKMNMPLGFDKETLDFELGGYEDETSFLGLVADYPSYIWDELRDFVSTYYHYAYCA